MKIVLDISTLWTGRFYHCLILSRLATISRTSLLRKYRLQNLGLLFKAVRGLSRR